MMIGVVVVARSRLVPSARSSGGYESSALTSIRKMDISEAAEMLLNQTPDF